jgi:hypothetical protein
VELVVAGEAQVGLMKQGGGAEGAPVREAAQAALGQGVELMVERREELVRGAASVWMGVDYGMNLRTTLANISVGTGTARRRWSGSACGGRARQPPHATVAVLRGPPAVQHLASGQEGVA